MKPETILKQYPEDQPWKRAAFLLFHMETLLFNERMAIGELVTAHHPSDACLDLINAAFLRNMKLIKGVNLCAAATPASAQSPEQHPTQ